ncbi:3-oxoacid CoA-transferase subunit A [Pseudonocardia zijingensis]|jgi:3-oxoacid CoA-transferase|uniref:3-oxoacid CoA-transferase subunit B n=1 Tax=Pseudonocardia zijingensis TaxID=153376 RepID=A0ABN1PYF8_9PSEU
MDKVCESPEAAIGDLEDGASIAVSGFGRSAGSPVSLLAALDRRGSRELCLVGNTIPPGAVEIVESGRVRHLITSFTSRNGRRSTVDEMISAGKLTFELVPQGTLVERLRAAGAGLGALYTPTGLNTPIADGKDVRYFDGRPYLLETAIRTDYAFISAYRADRLGNVEFRGANQHFGPSFAKAARVAIVEVDEIVDTGELPPERIGLPGIFVSRVVQKTLANDLPKYTPRRRASDVAREYGGKPGWTRVQIAEQAAKLLPDSGYVNLGLGIPSYISSFIADRDIVLHGENGILGYGEIVDDDELYPDVFNASGVPVTPQPGISFFDSVTAFEMVRSGRVHVVALGAYQVDAEGSVANWATPGMAGGGIGGAMDLAASTATVMVLMEHHDSQGRPKVVQRCTYPLTAKSCADIVVTDLAVFRRRNGALAIESVAPGFTADEVWALTEMDPPVRG